MNDEPIEIAQTNPPSTKKLIFFGAGILSIFIVCTIAFFCLASNAPVAEKSQTETHEESATPPPNLSQLEAETKVIKAALEKEQAINQEQALQIIQSRIQSQKIGSFEKEKDTPTNNQTASPEITDSNPNTAFLTALSRETDNMVEPRYLGDLRYIIGEGKILHGVLENAIDSSLPGTITGHITDNVYAEQGYQILIPKGSRLVGTYRAGNGLQNGQYRLFVVWQRILEPNGIVIPIVNESADQYGQAGLFDYVDHHYLERVGSAFLYTIIGFGAANTGVSNDSQYNSSAAYRAAMSQAFQQTASSELQQNTNIPPTIHIDPGTAFTIIANKDLNFEKLFQRDHDAIGED
jgi:type IV secretion system protein VirB10